MIERPLCMGEVPVLIIWFSGSLSLFISHNLILIKTILVAQIDNKNYLLFSSLYTGKVRGAHSRKLYFLASIIASRHSAFQLTEVSVSEVPWI